MGDSGCVNFGPGGYYPSQGSTCPGVAGRHNDGGNSSFCDGHVQGARVAATTVGLPFGAWTRRAVA